MSFFMTSKHPTIPMRDFRNCQTPLFSISLDGRKCSISVVIQLALLSSVYHTSHPVLSIHMAYMDMALSQAQVRIP